MTRSKLLTRPSKMPGWSWSLPAGASCPAAAIAAKLVGELSTCHGCYAKSGNYAWPGVRAAQERRFRFVRDSLLNDGGDVFVQAMVAELNRCVDPLDPFFRIHDSGDFFNVMYVKAWVRICEALPWIHFWAPTREWIRPLMLPVLRELAALPNVVVRPSAIAVNDPPPNVDGLQVGSTVRIDHKRQEWESLCPATTTDEKACDAHGCRKCWRAEMPIAYLVHGMQAKTMRARALRVLEVA